jgi:hypothetical protein
MNIIYSECLGQNMYYVSTCMSKHKAKQSTKSVCSKFNLSINKISHIVLIVKNNCD